MEHRQDMAHHATANERVLHSVPQAPEHPYSCDSSDRFKSFLSSGDPEDFLRAVSDVRFGDQTFARCPRHSAEDQVSVILSRREHQGSNRPAVRARAKTEAAE